MEPLFLALLVGTLSEIMLRSMAEQEPVFMSLVGLVFRERDRDLECDFEFGLLKDFLDYDRSERPREPLLLVFLWFRNRFLLCSSSEA